MQPLERTRRGLGGDHAVAAVRAGVLGQDVDPELEVGRDELEHAGLDPRRCVPWVRRSASRSSRPRARRARCALEAVDRNLACAIRRGCAGALESRPGGWAAEGKLDLFELDSRISNI